MKRALYLGCVLVFYIFSHAQDIREINVTFKNSNLELSNPLPNQYIWADSFLLFNLAFNILDNQLNGDDIPHVDDAISSNQVILQIPNPDGGVDKFRVLRNNTMHPDLQATFPEIRTFDVIGLENRLLRGKIDITPHGFHAMIFGNENGIYFIDPVQKGNNSLYMVYYKKHFVTNKTTVCNHDHDIHSLTSGIIAPGDIVEQLSYASCQKRTYRLALAATGEYTTFHGGTIALAQAAQVTTINRVNGIYEKEIAVTMQIIGNNHLLIYTNAASDPYTGNDDGAMLDQNITVCNNTIGSANYDIGHVFSQGSQSGVAYKGVICNNSYKAGGVTGNLSPQGDPFDVDYVAHEMGHQFGADHTQNNNCNRNGATAVEPGSASTILGYAGICSPNVQNNSDAYFHGISLGQIGAHITGSGGNCAVVTNLSNQAPVISSTNGGITIPVSTPFALTATASDPNSDQLYYRWEQTNNQVSTQPPIATATGGPNFRSIEPSTSPTRYFPNLQAVTNNGPFTWERLPSVSRTMNFRVTVHDNHPVAGCSDYINTTVTFDATAGPFVVTYPNATGISWQALSNQTVTWNVANTSNSNVNCQFVNIYLSTNGGTSYPTILATNVPNNGSASVVVPNLPNTTSRVMVQAVNGTFFDISNNNFTITQPVNGYTLVANNSLSEVCAGVNAQFNFNINQLGNYNSPVTMSVSGLPAGASASWTSNPITPPGTTSLNINTTNISIGSYNLTVNTSSAAGSQSVPITLVVNMVPLEVISLVSPVNNAVDVTSTVSFSWTAATVPDVSYQIDIASNSNFSNIITTQSGISGTSFISSPLNGSQTYYWRVRASNTCGTSPYSEIRSFTTENCQIFNSVNVPITISTSGTPTINSTLNINQLGTIQSISVQNLTGMHTYVSDLAVRLISPQGTQVLLFSGICGSQDNFNLNFSDAASTSSIPCPPTTGLTYKPVGLLSSLNGQQMNGTWTLQIQDMYNIDGGQLLSWGLNICYIPPCVEETPIFEPFGPFCSGASIPPLPTTSQNNFIGTWTPALNNTNSTTYTFTPNSGQCASTTQLTINITPSSTGQDNIVSAQPITWIDGNTYSESNNTATFNIVGGASNGCDSLVTLNLTIVPHLNFNLAASSNQICEGNEVTLSVLIVPSYPADYVHCNPSNPTQVIDVTNPVTGKTWMDRNLGANRAAISPTDAQAYGSLFQWGRFADGHQCVNRYSGDGVTTSGTTSTLSATATPNHGNFIMVNNAQWQSPTVNNLWQGVNGINNPCPLGYRIPTQSELNEERLSWQQAPINSTNNIAGGFASPLKLTMGGRRNNSNGSVTNFSNYGSYWSSTAQAFEETSFDLFVDQNNPSSVGWNHNRSNGVSVRCIKD